MEIPGFRILLVLVALRDEQDHPVLGQRAVHRLDRQVPRHGQRRDDERENDHIPQRKHREIVGDAEIGVRSGLGGCGHGIVTGITTSSPRRFGTFGKRMRSVPSASTASAL